MNNPSQQQTGFPTSGANSEFQPPINPVPGQPQIFFAGGVVAPPTGIYSLTPAPPGGLSSLGPKWTGNGYKM